MAVDPVTLSRLVDAEDFVGVLALVSVDEIADAWCQWSVRQSQGDVPPTTDESDWFSTDPHWWAVEFWWLASGRERVPAREALARDLLARLIDHAPSDAV